MVARRWLVAFLAGALMAGACTDGDDESNAESSTSTTGEAVTETDDDDIAPEVDAVLPDLEVALVWHQHQPRYPVVDGAVTRPWVRLHAAKDYVDMATLVTEFPDLRLTINLTPVLLDQLVELEAGARDTYWFAAETPIEQLTDDERQFIVDRFFDVNPSIIERFPRYVELRDRRDAGTAFGDQDLRDLRTLFHLAWLDPEMPEYVELSEARDRDFTDDDTTFMLAAHERLVAEVIPTHTELWESGQIEVITTPLAHPILPLIADTDLARVGDPSALLPRDPFREYGDAQLHVERGLATAEELLGQRPNGMWPGEGSVAQTVMPIFAEEGVEWVATGEDVLAKSLEQSGVGDGSFQRDDADTVLDPELLYRPWVVETSNGPVSMFFRDNRISDLIGFEYSGQPAESAVDDLMSRLEDIRSGLAGSEPLDFQPVVSIILDGENAWENYPNDGRDFLRALYGRLTTTDWITTTTPSTHLAEHPDNAAPLDEVFPAAWFSPDYGTWIGEAEEARAWDLLRFARQELRRAEQSGEPTPDQLSAATDAMLAAEGSDWFWWYGTDQDSGNDRYFDDAYRELLGQVYDGLDVPRPRWVDVPIIPDPPRLPDTTDNEARTIEVDGNPEDWEGATSFDLAGGTVPDLDAPVATLALAVDDTQLAIRVDGGIDDGEVEIYLRAPRGTSRRGTTIDDRLLGFDATHLIRWNPDDGACVSGTLLPVTKIGEYPRSCTPVDSASSEAGLEIGVPISELGALAAGDQLFLRVLSDGVLSPTGEPAAGPVPDIAGFEPTISASDDLGDDHGAGSIAYPTDPVFIAGAYDLVGFQAGLSGSDAVFSIQVDAPIANPWGSPVGLAIQTFDLYVDTGPGGRTDLLDGRNAQMADDAGWEFAITVEGWDPAVAIPTDLDDPSSGYEETQPAFGISVLGEEGRVTVRVPLAALPDGFDPADANIAVAVSSQEGFPSPGVRRIRDVAPTASQWQLGGGDSSAGTSRVVDVIGAISLAE